ncbi:hypothetical protein ITZ82_003299, partial [Escherichia coli]|nr:hypothetical protein [Escherichia coli]
MAIPLREYYKLPRAAELLGCNVDDLIHWAVSGYIDLAIYRSSIVVYPELPSVSYILNNDTYRKFITEKTIKELDN